jgi:Eco29kI restriction endonuclease
MSKMPYNPLDKLSLARSIELELLRRDVEPMPPNDVVGAGVYAIYSNGAFAPYAPITAANKKSWVKPIYVGKAIPKGGRKGGLSKALSASGTAISSRLRKHSESIKSAKNLKIDDFVVRYIILDDIWIPLGENILIETAKPLWNVVVEGFGINAPGKGRQSQKRSAWDVMHPGRSYAESLTGGGADLDAVVGRIDDHFAGRPLRSLPKALAAADDDPDTADWDEAED